MAPSNPVSAVNPSSSGEERIISVYVHKSKRNETTSPGSTCLRPVPPQGLGVGSNTPHTLASASTEGEIPPSESTFTEPLPQGDVSAVPPDYVLKCRLEPITGEKWFNAEIEPSCAPPPQSTEAITKKRLLYYLAGKQVGNKTACWKSVRVLRSIGEDRCF